MREKNIVSVHVMFKTVEKQITYNTVKKLSAWKHAVNLKYDILLRSKSVLRRI